MPQESRATIFFTGEGKEIGIREERFVFLKVNFEPPNRIPQAALSLVKRWRRVPKGRGGKLLGPDQLLLPL